MNVQYYHSRLSDDNDNVLATGGTTIAMEEIPVELFKQISVEHVLECAVGKARCSDKDNYNKKVGRNIAKGRMKNVQLAVNMVGTHPDGTIEVILSDIEGHQYTLVHKEGASTVRFVDYT